MAEPDDTRPEGVSLDGRPRRQPRTIDMKAVEVSLDGSGATTTGSGPGARFFAALQWPKLILTFLSPAKLAIIGSACIIAGMTAGALWLYLAPDGSNERDTGRREAAAPAVPDDVVERIAKLEAILKAPPSQASATKDLGDRATFDAMLAPLSDRVAMLERIVREAAVASDAGERADKAAGLFEQPPPYPPPHAGEGREGGEQNSAQQHERGALEDLASRVKTLESLQTALQHQQEAMDRLTDAMATPDKTVRAAMVAAALRSAAERDSPFMVEFAAARSLGLDESALASLEPFARTGLPTRKELFRELSSLMPELRRASVPPGRDVGYLDRLQASAIKMLNIRPVRDEPGDDPMTVMSRIEFNMVHQDIDATAAELDKLPARARELAQPWRTKALARQHALESAQLIATASLAKLGEPAVRGPSPP